MDDATTRWVFPTDMVVGEYQGKALVGLVVTYKLFASDLEEFQQRYVLTIEQTKAIAYDLLGAAEHIEKSSI